MLTTCNSLNKIQGIAPKDSVVAPLYNYKADTLHYYVVIVENVTFNLNEFKTQLSDFNTQYFSLNNLQINNRILGTNYQVVAVQSFPNRLGAFDYMRLIDDDDTLFLNMDMDITDAFIISAGNFNALMKDGKVTDYLDFYNRVYQ